MTDTTKVTTTSTTGATSIPRRTTKQQHYPRISATEFAAILNGSLTACSNSNNYNNHNTVKSAQQILNALRRFVYTVRSDRIMALFGSTTVTTLENDDDQDDDDDDDDGNSSNIHRNSTIGMDNSIFNTGDDDHDDDDAYNTGDENDVPSPPTTFDENEDSDDDENDEIVPMKRGNDTTITVVGGGNHGNDNVDVDLAEIVPATSPTVNSSSNRNKRKPEDSTATRDQPVQTAKKTYSNNERWKDDIASYNVPFVGTSISSMLSSSSSTSNTTNCTVRHNVWPTGLLQSYLSISPMAVEVVQNSTIAVPIATSASSSSSSSPSSSSSKNIHTLLLRLQEQRSEHNVSTTVVSSASSIARKAKEQQQSAYYKQLSQSIIIAYLQTISELMTAAIPIELLRQQYMNNNTASATMADGSNSSGSGGTQSDVTADCYIMSPQLTLPRFITDHILQQSQLSNILNLLVQDITASWKKNTKNKKHLNASSGGGSNGSKARTASSSITATIISLLHRLCTLSVSISRQIVRCIEQMIPTSMIRTILTFPTAVQTQHLITVNESNNPSATTTTAISVPTQVQQRQQQQSPQESFHTHAAFIATVHFVATLVEMNDATIFNCICNHSSSTTTAKSGNSGTMNTNDREVMTQNQPRPLGMLFVLLQRGFPTARVDDSTDATSDDTSLTTLRRQQQRQVQEYQYKMNGAIIRLLRVLRRFLFVDLHLNHISSTGSAKSVRTGSYHATKKNDNRPLLPVELFTRDCLQQLVILSTNCAPPLLNYEHVLSRTDQYDTTGKNVNDERDIGIETRRLLFILLSDPLHSPLLHNINFYRSRSHVNNNESRIQLIIRTMTQLISLHDGLGNYSSMIEVRRFIVHVTVTIPVLLPALLRAVQIDDDPRRIMSILSQMTFISTLLRHGPRIIDCFEHMDCSTDETDNSRTNFGSKSDSISCATIPLALKKQKLLKLLQNINPLIAFEGYKLLHVILHRCRDFIDDLAKKENTDPEFINTVLDQFQESVPDISVLIAGLMKLTTSTRDLKTDMMLLTCACEVIRTHCSLFLKQKNDGRPNGAHVGMIDLSKVIPTSTKLFLSTPIFMQRTVLATIQYVVESNEAIVTFQPNLFRSIFEVIVSTRSKSIYQKAHAIGILLLSHMNSNRDYETTYEASCWVDGLTSGTVMELCSLIKDSTLSSTPISVELGFAWCKAKLPLDSMPTRRLSELLVRGLKHLKQASSGFGVFIVQVATRCLLTYANPVPLAVMILEYHKTDDMDSTLPLATQLVDYANALVFFDRYTKPARTMLLTQLLNKTFQSPSLPLGIEATGRNRKVSRKYVNDHCLALSLQTEHVLTSTEGGDPGHDLLGFLRRILTVTLLPQYIETVNAISNRMFGTGDMFIECLLLTSITVAPRNFNEVASAGIQRSLSTARHETLSALTFGRSSIWYLYLVGNFLPDNVVLLVVDQMLQLYCQRSASNLLDVSTCRTISYFLRQLGYRMELTIEDVATMARHTALILDAWMAFDTLKVGDKIYDEFIAELENSLCSNLSRGYSSLAILEYEPIDLVRRCIDVKVACCSKGIDTESCLLSTIVSTDPSRFSSSLFQIHNVMKRTKEYHQIFIGGFLDTSLAIILNCDFNNKLYRKEVLSIAELVTARVSKLNSGYINDDKQLNSLLTVAHKMLTLQDKDVADVLNVRLLADFISTLVISRHQELNAKPTMDPIVANMDCIDVAVYICSQSSFESDNISLLSSTVFLYLCDLFVLNLRIQKGNIDTASSSAAPSSTKLIGCLQELIPHSRCFASILSTENGVASVKTVIKACIRHGMGIENVDIDNIRSSCMQLVISIIALLQNEKEPLGCLDDSTTQSIPSQVFTMVTSHSKFDVLMRSSEYCDIQVQISRILYTCITIPSDITFCINVWTSLLACFDAGVDENDSLLRCVLFEYSQIAKKVSLSLYVHQLRWGELARQNTFQDDWEWLVNSIEMNRIYATIDNFPVNDSIFPHRNIENMIVSKIQQVLVDSDQQRKQSRRYSPGFILPLILGALHADATMPSSDVSKTKNVQNPGINRGPLFVQRLSEKGAIALAVGALASNCSSLRRLSVAIIGLFVDALNRADARSSITWNSRPQIAMLLNSIQRALVLRFCIDPYGNESALINEIQQLPGFSATFLARASIILYHPSDTMYHAINRALLRSEEDGGGFQDLTRLPVFVALFCSAADTQEQLTAERKFALNLVKDGFTQATSYKLLMQCHCPELLLNSIEFVSVRSSFGSEDDLLLLFATLVKVVSVGADRAASHLIHRLGLVSWTRAFLLRKPKFLKTQVRVAFLKLLLEVLKAARHCENEMNDEDFVMSTRDIAQAVVSIALEEINSAHSRNQTENPAYFVNQYTCDILTQLSQAHNTIHSDTPLGEDFQHQRQTEGLHVESAVRFVEEVQQHPGLLRKAIIAVCILPMRFDNADITSVRRLCKLLMCNCRCLQIISSESKVTILRRLCFLSNKLHSEGDSSNDILQCLLLWRSDCIRCPEVRHMWYECVKTQIYDEMEGKVDFIACTAKESLLPLWILQNGNPLSVGAIT